MLPVRERDAFQFATAPWPGLVVVGLRQDLWFMSINEKALCWREKQIMSALEIALTLQTGRVESRQNSYRATSWLAHATNSPDCVVLDVSCVAHIKVSKLC